MEEEKLNEVKKEITYEDLKRVNETIKTTPIKGKDYAEVNQRIKAFRMLHPNGLIDTQLIKDENGVCTFKAIIYDENFKRLATGTAQEKEDSSFINKTSYIENCVPLDTQILTDNGWKYYYQLKDSDKALSLNLETKEIEYCDILNQVVYKNAPLIEMSTSRFKVVCTLQHKWVVDSQYTPIDRIATKDLKMSHRIINTIPQEIIGSEMGKKLGWLMCDCEIKYTKNGMPTQAEIRQSKYVKEITKLFGEGKKTKKNNDKWLDNYIWNISAEEVREILGKFDIVTYKDLSKSMLKAPIEDVKGCYESMMLADGSKGRFYSTYYELVEAVQIMCARLGIATTNITKSTKQNSTKPLYTLGIRKTSKTYVSELKQKNIPPRDVWCPETENHTWIMKQETYVTLTSNCETSAIGRALGIAGFGIDTSVASAEEVANAINNQEDQKEERKATPKQIEVLKQNYKDNNLKKLLEINNLEKIEDISMTRASDLISQLKKKGNI